MQHCGDQSLQDLTATLANVLADLKAVGGFELSEVQVGVEVTAEGGVNLIGKRCDNRRISSGSVAASEI